MFTEVKNILTCLHLPLKIQPLKIYKTMEILNREEIGRTYGGKIPNIKESWMRTGEIWENCNQI